MIFAVLFVLAFLLGLSVYIASNRWVLAVCVPSCVYALIILLDAGVGSETVISLIFGLPITFVAGLFGAYVVELRRTYSAESTEPEANDDPADADGRIPSNSEQNS